MHLHPSKVRIHIIGGGISGLICALELERKGYHPIILEKEKHIGGRLQTFHGDDFPMDVGFQVLLTGYPAATRYLDYAQLDLRKFLPGAAVIKNGRIYKLGNPFRSLRFLNDTLIFPFASFKDKLLVLQLVALLRGRSIRKIFESEEKTTRQYLEDVGFSQDLIAHFFKPFFSGIFLENTLETSSRMFEFVFKMFSEGSVAIPASGMNEIARQLKDQLNVTTISLDTPVSSIDEGLITLSDGREINSDMIIVACDPAPFFPSLKKEVLEWRKCTNVYFQVRQSLFRKPLLGLVADQGFLTNNFHFVSDVHSRPGNDILSVTVVKDHDLTEKKLIDRIAGEITSFYPDGSLKFLKLFEITKALPAVKTMRYTPRSEDIQISDQIFLSGDYLANPSLNGAMEAGRKTAEAVCQILSRQQKHLTF